EYACTSKAKLTAENLVTLLNCQLKSNNSYSTETWKLFFQNNADVLDQALLSYSILNPVISSTTVPQVLDAIEEVTINNFSNAQLINASFIEEWFNQKLQPFLASPSSIFLSCLSSKNFSCQTYQIVVKALSSQSASMNIEQQQLIFTRFIYPFLTRNGSSDPGCVSSTYGSLDWLQKNFGNYSAFVTVSEILALNPKFSSLDTLSLLTPSQVAQWTLSSGVLNNTNDITLAFEQLEKGDAFQNIDAFLTELTTNEQTLEIIPVVRDYMMNQTFTIISPHFPQFEKLDWIAWFEVKLTPILPSFTEGMLTIAISNVNCTNYQVIVKGLSSAFSRITPDRSEEFTAVLLNYLRTNAQLFNRPACRQDINSDTEWLEVNLGLYYVDVPYSDLKYFNISGVAVLDSLSPNQKAELILDTTSGALENVTLVSEVFVSLIKSEVQLEEFFVTFVEVTVQENITIIENAAVRDTILNLTLTGLAPYFYEFEPVDFQLWFQVNLQVVLASFSSASLVVIPLNITCESYNAIYLGLDQSLESLPPNLSQGLMSAKDALMEAFQSCPRPPVFIGCKDTQINEVQLCAGVDSSLLEQQLSSGIASANLCDYNIAEYACTSKAKLTAENLVTLLNCQLKSNNSYSTETWKLFFQNNAEVLDQALLSYSI
ncbi:hypothetical protein UPYG_G00226240, partial [Umbra pygmaea]